jgi:hypothetical protein
MHEVELECNIYVQRSFDEVLVKSKELDYLNHEIDTLGLVFFSEVYVMYD